MELKNRINTYISTLNLIEKIIFLNIVIYFLPYLITSIFYLFDIDGGIDDQTRLHNVVIYLLGWFTIDSNLSELIIKPWSILTYGFLHDYKSFSHIFWNMLVLYYFGNILKNIFGDKLIKNLFLTGIIAGGLTYVLSYNIFPVFKDSDSAMVGASAGVYSVLFYLTTYSPSTRIRLLFFDLKILYIALFFIFKDIYFINSDNSGGHIAHIGGALWGYYYCVKYNNGNDLVNSIFSYFKRNKRSKPTFKSKKDNKSFDQKKIDEILDKISDSGYDSLTKSEKEYLFKVGKDDN